MIVKVEFTMYQAYYMLAKLEPLIRKTAVATDEGQALRRLYNCIKFAMRQERDGDR